MKKMDNSKLLHLSDMKTKACSRKFPGFRSCELPGKIVHCRDEKDHIYQSSKLCFLPVIGLSGEEEDVVWT